MIDCYSVALTPGPLLADTAKLALSHRPFQGV